MIAKKPEPKNAALNESPSEKEGKWKAWTRSRLPPAPLNESPSEKEGKYPGHFCHVRTRHPSMKVPPKRKGNKTHPGRGGSGVPLNESPSEKEGKYLNTPT